MRRVEGCEDTAALAGREDDTKPEVLVCRWGVGAWRCWMDGYFEANRAFFCLSLCS